MVSKAEKDLAKRIQKNYDDYRKEVDNLKRYLDEALDKLDNPDTTVDEVLDTLEEAADRAENLNKSKRKRKFKF